ncbi:hypothetical protein ACFU53_41170 [Streptomyces sp. NPDC057474]
MYVLAVTRELTSDQFVGEVDCFGEAVVGRMAAEFGSEVGVELGGVIGEH